MSEIFEEYGKIIGLIILTIIIIAIVSIGLRFMDVSTSKAIIEHSKSYIDSRNEKASVLIQEYESGGDSQRKYLLTEICEIKDELESNSSKLLVKFSSQNCN